MGIIKVADFGLSESLYTKDYYKQTSDSNSHVKLPIKWMALESIHYGKFSEKTDVVCKNPIIITLSLYYSCMCDSFLMISIYSGHLGYCVGKYSVWERHHILDWTQKLLLKCWTLERG